MSDSDLPEPRNVILAAMQPNRMAGLALIAGGAFALIWGSAHLIPALMLGSGLWVAHRQQSAKSGKSGWIGFGLLALGLISGAGLEVLSVLFPQVVARTYPMNYLLTGGVLAFGMLIYGISIIRAKVFPAIAGKLLVAGPLLIVLIGGWGTRISFVGFIVLGYLLFAEKFNHQAETIQAETPPAAPPFPPA